LSHHIDRFSNWIRGDSTKTSEDLTVGGQTESFAFGQKATGTYRTGSAQFEMSPYSGGFRIKEMVGSSTQMVADVVGEASWLTLDSWNMQKNYVSPAARSKQTSMVLGDGGIVDNVGVIPMVQRELDKIIVFLNPSEALAPASAFPPSQHYSPTNRQVTGIFGTFFGVRTKEYYAPGVAIADMGTEHRRNAVFQKSDWTRVITALQKSMDKGYGAVATVTCTTIENKWFGIKGGRKIEITWSYLARSPVWEGKMRSDVRKVLDDVKDFPQIGMMEHPKSTLNFITNYAAWLVEAHSDVFKKALS
jgi:hypothetical protein